MRMCSRTRLRIFQPRRMNHFRTDYVLNPGKVPAAPGGA